MPVYRPWRIHTEGDPGDDDKEQYMDGIINNVHVMYPLGDYSDTMRLFGNTMVYRHWFRKIGGRWDGKAWEIPKTELKVVEARLMHDMESNRIRRSMIMKMSRDRIAKKERDKAIARAKISHDLLSMHMTNERKMHMMGLLLKLGCDPTSTMFDHNMQCGQCNQLVFSSEVENRHLFLVECPFCHHPK